MSTTALQVVESSALEASSKSADAVAVLHQTEQAVAACVTDYALLSVTDEQTKLEAESALIAVRDKVKELDGQRKEWVSPFYQVYKAFNTEHGNRLSPLRQLEDGLVRSIQAYRAEQQRRLQEEQMRKAQEAMKDAQERAAAGESVDIPETVVSAVEAAPEAHADTITYKRLWRWEVVDESQLPEHFVKRVPNEALIDAAVKDGVYHKPGEKLSSNKAKIAGIRIYAEDIPTKKAQR